MRGAQDGRYEQAEDEKRADDNRRGRQLDQFGLRLAHKGADLPMLDDEMNQTTITTGVGSKEIAILGLLALGCFALYLFTQWNPPPTTPPTAPPPATSPADIEFGIRFYDQYGEPITLQNRGLDE